MVNIGEKIKELRNKNKLTQQELGDKLFVSDKTISSWESNRTEPDLNMLLEISKVLDVNIINLLHDCNQNNIETEIKIKTSEREQDRLLEKIKNESVLLKEEDQEALYYKLNKDNEWLRIRKESNNYKINYKRKNTNELSEEYEVSINDINNMKIIFNNLGLEESVTVKKHRVSYLYKDKYEISFDDVDNLGLYVEIEINKYEFDNEKEIELLINLMKELNINMDNIENKRYPELLSNNMI